MLQDTELFSVRTSSLHPAHTNDKSIKRVTQWPGSASYSWKEHLFTDNSNQRELNLLEKLINYKSEIYGKWKTTMVLTLHARDQYKLCLDASISCLGDFTAQDLTAGIGPKH